MTCKKYFPRFFLVVVFLIFSFNSFAGGSDTVSGQNERFSRKKLIAAWTQTAGKRKGKVIYSLAPDMYVLYLERGLLKKIPNIITAGGNGRKPRGKTPRPSWSPDGSRFSYCYNNSVFICDEKGNKKAIFNPAMDTTDETRWTWRRENNRDWLVGPAKNGNVIQVLITDPAIIKTLYDGGDVEKHCEITGNGYIVYDDGDDIFIRGITGTKKIKISNGQSCRPCASPDSRVAWLNDNHSAYLLYDTPSGRESGKLNAPPGQEIYRLNWSNLPDFAVHMFGSVDNNNMHIRQISTGASIFIGWGWDPDLWIEPTTQDF